MAHTQVEYTHREREHREWTHSFRSIETVCFEPTTIVQLINDFQNQYRIRIRAVRFYIFIHSLRLRHCLDICARAQRTTTTTTTISTTHSTVISTTRAQQTSSSSSISTQQSNLSNTVDFVTVTPFAIASLLFLCFASSFFLFVIVYCLSRYFTPFVCVCAVADWHFLCTHTHTHYTQQKSWYESVSIVILLEIIFIVYSLLSCSVLLCTMCNFYLVLNLYPLFCFVLFEFIYDLVWSNLSTCCFPFHLLFPIASVHLFETQLAIDDLSQ